MCVCEGVWMNSCFRDGQAVPVSYKKLDVLPIAKSSKCLVGNRGKHKFTKKRKDLFPFEN